MLEMGITFDLAQLVLDNEIAGMIKHAVGGIPVNDETLAVDIIKEVGIFQDYLAHDSTFEHMRIRSEATLIDRQMRPQWEAAGGTDMYQRAQAKVRDILANYVPPQLSAEVLAKVRQIIENAEAELGISGGK
jgi:trimethylamine---corrinoid protein Co-methyltransferase